MFLLVFIHSDNNIVRLEKLVSREVRRCFFWITYSHMYTF